MASNEGPLFSAARYQKVAFAVICILLAIAAFLLILPFWQAIAWGIALAILVNPIYRRLNKRFSNQVSAAITTLLTLLFIIIPLGLVGLAFYVQANQVRTELSHGSFNDILNNANTQVNSMAANYGFKPVNLKEVVDSGMSKVISAIPQMAGGVIHGLLTFVFSLLLLFFLLRDSWKLRSPAKELLPLPSERSDEIIRTVYDTVHATFYGIVLVALAQGTILGLSFWILGLPAPLLWGVITVVLCTIPFAGAPIVWLPACAYLLYQGDIVRAIILAFLGVAVIGLIDNIFRPIIIGARVRLHPMAVFFAIFGGIVVLGPVGILVGPVLLSVTLGAIEVLREIAGQENADASAVSDVQN